MNPSPGDQAPPGALTPQELSTAYGRALVQEHLGVFDLVFSAGPYCRSAFHLRRLFDQTQAFPFDWWLTPASSALRMLHPDYRFGLKADALFFTQSAQAVLNVGDLTLHLHDFERTTSGALHTGDLERQLAAINDKYTYLFARLRERLRQARRCLVVFEGLMPASELETYRQRTACGPLSYPQLQDDFASELVALLRQAYGVEARVVCFGIGAPGIESQGDLLRISAPLLPSALDVEAEPYQRPWASYDLLLAQLCSVLANS